MVFPGEGARFLNGGVAPGHKAMSRINLEGERWNNSHGIQKGFKFWKQFSQNCDFHTLKKYIYSEILSKLQNIKKYKVTGTGDVTQR